MSINELVQIGHSLESAICMDAMRRANKIADALVVAFGGRSQIGLEDIGRAAAGQINNGGFCCHGSIYEVCTWIYEATLYDNEADYDNCMPTIVGECIKSLDSLGIDYKNLPYKPYLYPKGGY